MTAESAGTPARRRPLRASDADRDATVELLREAAAEGRLDLDELDERLEAALTAKTVAELGPLTEDLVPDGPPGGALVAADPLVLKGGVHGVSRVGGWNVPSKIVARGGMGGVKLDFTRTRVRLAEVEVEVYGEMAGVTVVVPEGWAVDSDGVDPGLGGMRNKVTGERRPGTPLIRLVGAGGAAGVTARHPGPWERRKLRKQLGS
ncbi:DUF1707 SHOCT-like domain-containing protein [Streptomyces candidus]|uniref:DUF1707 domain-containing protein n=1 Tax=Streptomyces candidus TaxID=67283 RepID=A0A7X0LNT1_9ACTN|nr:DUF1707 domain-containing protein [Streptomyces candidus]MBB6435210.1 hypothetical protein [Streptomyces candidus]GHH40452.1 hypothetical protein GCM10018773_21560 [Streptomyces candidus]